MVKCESWVSLENRGRWRDMRRALKIIGWCAVVPAIALGLLDGQSCGVRGAVFFARASPPNPLALALI